MDEYENVDLDRQLEQKICQLSDKLGMAEDAGEKRIIQKRQEVSQQSEALTPREKEVIELLVKGGTNKLIAKTLEISPRTVEVHRQAIFEKFDVHSVSQLLYLLNQRSA